MDVSVIIPVLNGAEQLPTQLAALAAQQTSHSWEVVIGDNGSTDNTLEVIEQWRAQLPHLRVVDASAKPGAGYARNTAVAASTGRILAFCDCDDEVAAGWVESAATTTTVKAGLVISRDGHTLNPEVTTQPTSWRVLSGNFTITRELFDQVEGFDADLSAYAAEDMDFSLRLREAGLTIASAPDLLVTFTPTTQLTALLRKVYLNGKGEVLIQAKRDSESLPPLGKAAQALALWPVAAAQQLVREPSTATVKKVGRDAARRAGHFVGRATLKLPRHQQQPAPTALWVTPVSNLAGVARHIVDATKVGVPGWRIVVAAPEGPLLEQLRAQGTPCIATEIGTEVPTLKAVANLRSVIASVEPAIVHSHLARADILAALAGATLPVSLVSTEHHISPDRLMFHSSSLKASTMERVHQLRLKRFAALIAVSASTARDMRKFWHTKQPITVIRNGVDRPAQPVTRAPGLRLLSLARLSPEKNIEMTLRSFALIYQQHPEAVLTIAGEGEEHSRLEELAAGLGISSAVNFVGFVDAQAAMASHDVIMQPSKSDNLSYTLIDAVAQGMGVAASPIGGNPEILPERCIASLDDDAALARIAIEQGLQLDKRPILPDAVPTLTQMTEQIADVYRGLAL